RSSYGDPAESKRVLALPALVTPPDVTITRGGGWSSGFDEVHATVELRADVAVPVALLRHYVSQLNAHGWTATLPVSSDNVAAAVLATRDSSGRAWTGTIVVGAREKQVLVNLMMHPVTQ